jgi:hypothetical protein
MLAAGWGTGDVIWATLILLFALTAMYGLIMAFADIYRRRVIGGEAKRHGLL